MKNIDYSKIKIIAHRLGYNMTNFPENSLDALKDIFYNENKLNSCSGFEFDINFTKDNIPVIIHDKRLDDVTKVKGNVKNYTLAYLQKLDFSFRKSLNNDNDYTFKILTLEECLSFFIENKDLLGNKVIKIETKDNFIYNKKKCYNLAVILEKMSSLNKNIVHLSFVPYNLKILRKIQKENNYYVTSTDLLCDFNIGYQMFKKCNYIDAISLRNPSKNQRYSISNFNGLINKFNAAFASFCYEYADGAIPKNIVEANRNKEVGIYVINEIEELDLFTDQFEEEIINELLKNITITSNNPEKLLNQINSKY